MPGNPTTSPWAPGGAAKLQLAPGGAEQSARPGQPEGAFNCNLHLGPVAPGRRFLPFAAEAAHDHCCAATNSLSLGPGSAAKLQLAPEGAPSNQCPGNSQGAVNCNLHLGPVAPGRRFLPLAPAAAHGHCWATTINLSLGPQQGR